MTDILPPLALTMGDPAGIGPEITAKAWRRLRQTGPAFVWIGPVDALPEDLPAEEISRPSGIGDLFCEALPVINLNLAQPVSPGRPDPASAPVIIESIMRAVTLTQTGQTSGVVTCPISKAVLSAGGFRHPGHTEFLAELCRVPGREVMMLAGPELRVVPVTIHVSLRDALDSLTTDAIIAAGRTTAEALRRDFGIAQPRLAVAGLNPHAGENGLMGTEEKTLIAPAIAALRAEGMDVTGPLPPDTMFTPAARARYDAALCMYHDQALIPLKTLDMEHGVNVTLGLPIVRTSPDHGTAFDIAGQGTASPESLISALQLAWQMAGYRATGYRKNGGADR
ncbi:4-hydroxythreonine-4-phosphate dehydrogenase PdxA [Acetobacter sp. AN02]|uniref:4-hydroxythreonine-4-phosphate dehydrogenase PdxA n=1 Tax=Acetobacter sp. AN02 TaxID=2894186 RepID=UPI002434566F|nr:4-hydroxythreonine-4-phosphate dehydrogenase PdxA [Acetobacter sp. AN02]MDG6094295.1 4-hydroxythreonine-4-phosphate dehydrogenase PdxA [Acetobacter sp. AN02]